MFYKLKIKSLAYNCQGNHAGQVAAIDWQIAVRRDNVISNQGATQLSSRGWLGPIPNLIHI